MGRQVGFASLIEFATTKEHMKLLNHLKKIKGSSLKEGDYFSVKHIEHSNMTSHLVCKNAISYYWKWTKEEITKQFKEKSNPHTTNNEQTSLNITYKGHIIKPCWDDYNS